MFRRARLRLTAVYIVLFAVALGLFSVVFYAATATLLAPDFDLAPELTNEQAAAAAYQVALERIGITLIVANLLAVVLIAVFAWSLAGRTLRPIREAHARQRRFVADASHEMRTPLAAIRASAEGALAAAETTAELRDALAVDAKYAARLTRITDDLLLLARTEYGEPRPLEPVDLSVVVAEAVATFAVAHPEWPPATVSLAADLPVAVDALEVGRIVSNLLDNAYRYGAGDAGSVRIATAAGDREAHVEVRDDGPGIAAADLDQIFEPFHRVDGTSASDGSGLGLAIARDLATRNGGDLTVVSRPGSGATFRLSLPRLT